MFADDGSWCGCCDFDVGGVADPVTCVKGGSRTCSDDSGSESKPVGGVLASIEGLASEGHVSSPGAID